MDYIISAEWYEFGARPQREGDEMARYGAVLSS